MRILVYTILVPGIVMSAACAQSKKASDQPAAATAAPAPAAAGTKASGPAAEPAKSETLEMRMMCTRDTDSRLLRLVRLEPKGCRLLYPNAANEIASSSVGPTHCETVRDRIQKNLESVGFKCAAEGDASPAAKGKSS